MATEYVNVTCMRTTKHCVTFLVRVFSFRYRALSETSDSYCITRPCSMFVFGKKTSIQHLKRGQFRDTFLKTSQIKGDNSIHVYLRANLTARRPITKYARVCRNKQQKSYSKNDSLHNNKIIIIQFNSIQFIYMLT
jgi:hypothetical protein